MGPRIIVPFVALLMASACAAQEVPPPAPAASNAPPSTTAAATRSASGQDTRPALAKTRSSRSTATTPTRAGDATGGSRWRLPGGLGLLTYRIKNDGAAETWFNELHQARDWMSFKYRAAFNVTLTDVAARRQYLPGRLQVPAEGGTVQ
ncbi:hypothetical protein ACQEVF_20250 [Nonomuraea polychroma]|uniref:hypothetical protein n=1 Tax=Nonomuraea polychroma TaxID=46176 RepID=UPI003D91E527